MEKKKKIWIWVLVALFTLLLIATFIYLMFFYGKTPKKKKEHTVTPVPVKTKYKITSPELSDFDLYFLQLEENGNVVYSPLSIKYALAMLKEGADGDTKAQIEGIIGDYQPKVYPNNDNMSFGNAFFIRDSYEKQIKQGYIDSLKERYNADIIYDGFKSPDKVNKWISDKTFKLIENMVDDVSEFDFILVNALAIDMEWVNKIQPLGGWDEHYEHEKYSAYVEMYSTDYYPEFTFEGENVKSSVIGASINKYNIISDLGEDNIRKTLSDEYDKWEKESTCEPGSETKEEVIDRFVSELKENYGKLSSSTDFEFYDDEEIKIFAKDLKEYDNTTLEYIAIMPKSTDLKSFISDMNANSISNMISKLKKLELDSFEEGYITDISGNIPLFEYEYELKLIDDLNSLGIIDVFDSTKSDLSKMSKTSAFIDQAKHKALIEFSNDGIKAAAATMMGGKGSAGCAFYYDFEVPVKKIDLSFDKPYIYLVRDKKTGEVWFAGSVYEPIKNATK